MVIQNASHLNKEELLAELTKLKITAGAIYYDIMEPSFAYNSEEVKKEAINELHALRCEISRIQNILMKRGFRNI